MNEIVLYHHLGLGDHFTCNGLVHFFAKKYSKVHLPCWKHYLTTVSSLYEDFNNIIVFPIEKEPEDVYAYDSKLPVLRIGFEKTNMDKFERSFYEQYGIPYQVRFDEFKLPKNLKQSQMFEEQVKQDLGNDYIFIHNQSSSKLYDLNIESTLPKKFLRVTDTPNLLDYVHTLQGSKEIHVINSGIVGLIINMHQCKMLEGVKIFYHTARKISEGGIPLEVPAGFNIVEYNP